MPRAGRPSKERTQSCNFHKKIFVGQHDPGIMSKTHKAILRHSNPKTKNAI